MDAKDYDRIADKLMQFRGKMLRWQDIKHEMTKYHTRETKILIDSLLQHIEILAQMDDKGWIE